MIIYGLNKQVGEWIQANGGGKYRDGAQCIGQERDGRLVAGAMYDSYNGASMCVHVAAIGSVSRDFLRAAFHYPFNELGCEVLIGFVADDNRKAQVFDERLGFQYRYAIPGAHPSGALRIYTMNRNDCRWIDHVETRRARRA